ncbi:hypothetical protein FB45DRAFT_1008099 [Roridomyces roridus]|uniref:Uncharacterized protein n=1 Tax=Roridomyces roridus TaxID=1738132 RepID=A0AAD7FEM9_9AGAR|nr:hypothetical protein FB45DRAFT_1008099 [Roridomyces roridus]
MYDLRITRFVIINKLLPREMDVACLNKEWIVPGELPLGYEDSSTCPAREGLLGQNPTRSVGTRRRVPNTCQPVEGQKYMPGVTWVLDIEPIHQEKPPWIFYRKSFKNISQLKYFAVILETFAQC